MKKHTAVHVLGGTMAAAARAMGLRKQTVTSWRTDAHGNLVSRHVCDMVLATLVRQNYKHRAGNPEGERFEFDDDTLRDLLHLPAGMELGPEYGPQ